MNIEQALYAHLAAYGNLTFLVGNRIYPDQLPERVVLPAVTYTRVSTATLKHRSSRKPTYSRPRFQLDGWGATDEQAFGLRYALRDAMAEFQRSDDPRVDVALLQDDRDIVEAEPGRWRASLDYFISHRES